MVVTEEDPFVELPGALVEEMLSKGELAGDILYKSYQTIENDKINMREQLLKKNLLIRDTDLGYTDIPTTCGIDGSYGIERLVGSDLVACAAVAVEGLTPPSEKTLWSGPQHRLFVQPEKHSSNTSALLKALMMMMETELAVFAQHGIVFLDGSFETPLISVNQGVSYIQKDMESDLSSKVYEKFIDFHTSYQEVLRSSRTDKMWVSMPKYTSKRELGKALKWPSQYDDRGILTSVLQPGEVIRPMPLESPIVNRLNLPYNDRSLENLTNDTILALKGIHVMYYKPHKWIPAFRIEISRSIANNDIRLASLLQGIKHQCRTASILEPYPLYLADRMVKHLGKAIPAFRQVTTRKMIELHQDDLGDIFLNMHAYRSENGR
ncbi:MAG TPA: DNA double-strand break repair nuclease NurA [Spirochaetes bacterium]|nr:DNA double-strand break repair nuclease NurA [Spirochaetota bacterium]